MTKLSGLPRLLPFFIELALLVTGVWISGPIGFLLLALVAGFVGWVLYLSWPRLTQSLRIMRLAVLLLAIALAVVQLFPRTRT